MTIFNRNDLLQIINESRARIMSLGSHLYWKAAYDYYTTGKLPDKMVNLFNEDFGSIKEICEKELDMLKTNVLVDVSVNENGETFKCMINEFLLSYLYLKLKLRYGKYVNDNPEWTYNLVGGIKARIRILSLLISGKQYIALFGSPFEQTGESERYSYMDVDDLMVSGYMYSAGCDSMNALPRLYSPDKNQVSTLKANDLRVYKFNGYMLDFGYSEHEGFLKTVYPSFLQGVILPGLFIDQDFVSVEQEMKEGLESIKQQACTIM